MAEQQSVVSDSMPLVKTPEELRDFLNNDGVPSVTDWLDYLTGEDGQSFSIEEDERRFITYWLEKANKRILVIQNNLVRLPGLFLQLPLQIDSNELAPGEISAHYIPMTDRDKPKVPQHYTDGSGIGNRAGLPITVVKIIGVAEQELRQAAGELSSEDI